MDFSKLSEEELDHIANGRYENLSDEVLNQLSKDTSQTQAQTQEVPESKKSELNQNRILGAGIGAGLGMKAAPYIGSLQASKLFYDKFKPTPDIVEDATGAYTSKHGVGEGAVKNASHNVDQIVKNQVAEAALHEPGYVSPGNSRLLIPEEVARTSTVESPKKPESIPKMKAALTATGKALTPSGFTGKLVNTAVPVPALTIAGAEAGDALTRAAHGDYGRAGISALGATGAAATMIPNKYARLFGMGAAAAAPAINYLTDKIYGRSGYAEGGDVQHFENGGVTLAKKAANFLFKPRETQIMKASEALAPHEGKYLNVTQSDRMRSTNGDLGGPGFSKFQNENPIYAEAKAAWGVGKKPTASGIVNVNKRFPEGQAIWTPMIGGETQHHSNQHVYDMLTNEFNRQSSMGNLPKELRERINQRLASAPATKGMLPENFDIANPEHLQQYGNTFDRRGAISTALSGQGVGGTKGRIIDYPGIMQEMTDPMTIGSPTHAIGTRLFTLNNEVSHRPDLHSAFPYILGGTDQGVSFNAVPKELGIPDFINQFKDFKGRDPGYYDLVRTTPSQQITDKYLRSLQEAGHAEGGEVQGYAGGKAVTGALEYIGKKIFPAAEREANKAKYLENSAVKTPMYHGTSSDITEFKPKTAGTIFVTSNPRFAESFGDAHQKQLVKNVKDRMPDKEFLDIMRNGGYDNLDNVVNLGLPARQNIMPVHVNATNPFDYENPQHVEALFNELNKADGAPSTHSIGHGSWDLLELPHVQAGIKNLGHDSYFVQEGGQKNLGLYQPTQLKSAIGNEGSFNPLDPDITKKEGGEVQHFENGGITLAKKVISQVPEVAQALEAYLRGHISNAERMDILNKHLPIRKWNELPPSYTNEQIRAALMANKQPKALAEVPVGMQVGNRLDIPAYTQNGVYVDTVHNAKGTPISYNRTGHLQDVEFSSKPNQAVRVGLGTKEQALTPMGAEMGSGKSPFALMKGTNIGTHDDEVRRMMQEYLNDPNWTQIGMDPRRNSQFYDKSTGLPVFSATEKLQSGPLVMVPKGGLESSHWEDPRLLLSDFEGKHYAGGGHATPAWQRSEGKNPEGGLNAAGRASYNREHGAHLKAPQPEGGSRKDSFCARMSGMKKKLTSSETANDPDSRINKSLRKWKC